jgi:hypothetical protein
VDVDHLSCAILYILLYDPGVLLQGKYMIVYDCAFNKLRQIYCVQYTNT